VSYRSLGIDFLRFSAIVLVINSHMDSFYPIPELGTGGALGNALFFMLSAFGPAQAKYLCFCLKPIAEGFYRHYG
jgi:peptidoglycan/LPS O-acetylase OafA/YrhL